MGKKSRDKGKVGEREARDVILSWGLPAHRGRQFKGTPDSPDVVTVPGLHCEVKRRNAGSVTAWMEEAAEDVGGRGFGMPIPFVIHRRDGKPWLVTVHAVDVPKFAEIISEFQKEEVESGGVQSTPAP